MTNYDDAAVERVARWLYKLEIALDEMGDKRWPFEDFKDYYEGQAREVIALLTPPPDPV